MSVVNVFGLLNVTRALLPDTAAAPVLSTSSTSRPLEAIAVMWDLASIRQPSLCRATSTECFTSSCAHWAFTPLLLNRGSSGRISWTQTNRSSRRERDTGLCRDGWRDARLRHQPGDPVRNATGPASVAAGPG